MGTRKDGTNTGKIRIYDNRDGMIRNESEEEKEERKFEKGTVRITFSLAKKLMPKDIEDDDLLLTNVMLDDTLLLSNVVLCKGRDIEKSIRNKTDFKFLHIHVEVLGFHGKANLK